MKSAILILLFLQVFLFAQWKRVEQLPAEETGYIYKNNDTLYAGCVNKLFISTNSGNDWTETSIISGEIDFIPTIIKAAGKIFVGTYYHGVFVSSDEGNSWQPFNSGFSGLGSNVIRDFEVRGDSIYAATDGAGIFLLNLNGGSTWVHFSNGLNFSTSYNVSTIYNWNGALFAGAGGNPFVYINNRGADNWQEIQFDEFRSQPNTLFSFYASDEVLLGLANFGIYKSLDTGKTWQWYNPGIGYIGGGNFDAADSKIYALLVKVGSSYYYTSDNAGETWNIFDQPVVFTYNFLIHDYKIYSTQTGGLFYRDLTPVSVDDPAEINSFYLYQNYPNPFNPSTQISFSLPEEGDAKLTVFDALGREIAIIMNDRLTSGKHIINFNSSEFSLSSGVYFYRLESGGFVQTKKMLILQ